MGLHPTLNQYDELLDAMDNYREKRNSWRKETDRNGFYDPQGYQEKRAKREIKKGEERLNTIFSRIVRNCLSD